MPLYTVLHSLLNVLAQIANKMGLHKGYVDDGRKMQHTEVRRLLGTPIMADECSYYL
jgi:hypothetical protein